MITALRLKNKIRQKHKGESNNSLVTQGQENINTEIQRQEIPRPPGRRLSEQIRPPERRRTDEPRLPGRKLTDDHFRLQFKIPCGKTSTKKVMDVASPDHRRVPDQTNHIKRNKTLNRATKTQVQVNRERKEGVVIKERKKPKRDDVYGCHVPRYQRRSDKRTEQRARGTRNEVNARLGNIEKSLQDLAISTRGEVYTRLRKIENSLKDITGRRRKTIKQQQKRPRQPDSERKDYFGYIPQISNKKQPKNELSRKRHSKLQVKFQQKNKRRKIVDDNRKRNNENFIKAKRIAKVRTKTRRRRVVPEESHFSCKGHSKSETRDRYVSIEEPPKKDWHFSVFEDTSINVRRTPRLKTTIDTTVEGDFCPPDLRGIVVVVVNNITTIVVTDWANRSIKSFYSKNKKSCYSQLKLDESPWGLKKLKDNMVGLTVPKSQQVMTFEVNPNLVLLSTIQTSRKYWGLSVMTSSTLIAGASKPASIDVLDMDGNVLQSFCNFTTESSIENPDCLHVTKNGNILLSDSGTKSVVCLTSSGDVIFTYVPAVDRPLLYPSGLISTSSGDILLADSAANKIVHLQESGTFFKDVLGSKSDVDKPFGLCVHGDDLYIATRCRTVQVFSFL